MLAKHALSQLSYGPVPEDECFFTRSPSLALRRSSLRSRKACRAEAGAASEGWWSQTGSNRRPHACKARALPAELWPQFLRRPACRDGQPVFAQAGYAGHASPFVLRGCATRSRRRSVVGLGRLELPTSRLSSARSNQLSYKPLTLSLSKRIRDRLARKPTREAPDAIAQARQPLARVRPRRKRNVDGEIPPMELSNPETAGP